MSYLSDSLKKLKYDKRMLHWNLRQKNLTKEEHEKHLKDLEDLSHLKAEEKELAESRPEKQDSQSES